MKYNKSAFDSAVEDYKKILKSCKGENLFILFRNDNKEAFYSMAPLSRAAAEIGCDLCAVGHGKERPGVDVLFEVWAAMDELDAKKRTEGALALQKFISAIEGKIPDAKNLFRRPKIVLEAGAKGFTGDITLPFNTEWMKEHRASELLQTAKILWRDVYNIKKSEVVGVGFLTIPLDKMLGHPLEDYLDSYPINWAMTSACPGTPILSAYSVRESMLEPSEKVSDLRAMLLGCEMEKEINQEPFISFKPLAKALQTQRLRPADASFSTSGKGYPGKHRFGDAFGYPSPNGKTKWKTPGQLAGKFDFYPQTRHDERGPQTRIAFTETLPIDVFIETNLVDWTDIRNRNQKVKEVMDKCDIIFVKGKKGEKYTTDLEVGLIKPDGKRRWVRRSDTDVREKINKEYLKMTGIVAGCMGNIPGGEAFVTPQYIKGTFVGDVVIAIDQSYPLSAKDPFVVKCMGNSYEVLTAPKDVLKKFNQRKDEAWKLLLESEKNKALPEDIIKMKKDNFGNIGEFAINTNPKAKLCDYLIVNEKIAKMMHIALGSGYEDDRSTDYHIDIVFDAPRQKLDVWGTDGKGKEHWILKDGEFVA